MLAIEDEHCLVEDMDVAEPRLLRALALVVKNVERQVIIMVASSKILQERSISSPYMKKSSSSKPTLSRALRRNMQKAPLTTSIRHAEFHGRKPM